jgi:ubiquinone/menaquinone biosynthesis C-methylase UbiE
MALPLLYEIANFSILDPENKGVSFIHANAIEALPFSDKYFDVSIASYVAHGMGQDERKRLYAEMSRVTKYKVVIYDYNEKRTLLTTIIEWLEGGGYFHFIKNAESEMRECFIDSCACFSAVQVFDVDSHAAWYICTCF